MVFRIILAFAILCFGIVTLGQQAKVIRIAHRDGRMVGGALPTAGGRPIYLRDDPEKFRRAVRGRIVFTAALGVVVLYMIAQALLR